MDYEKAYKASLKTAAQWIKDGCTDKEKICLECVFPELRESEDERIRMKLFHTVRGTPKDNEWFEDISKDAMLAYLEKQKENPKSADSFTDDIIEVRSFQRGMEEGRRLEKQKEQNKCPEFCSGHCVGCERNEQKDYRKLYEDIAKSEWFKKAYEGKSLGDDDEQKEQKPAEWSEEDERLRLACIATINDVIDYERDRWEDYNPGKPFRPITKYDEQIDWLKHLRPSWKPTYEQVEALRKAVNKLADTEVADSVRLSIMYDHLKELV